MGIKPSDSRNLWARSGNRCAFTDCQIELTPSGSLSTLGEVAHIVAKRSNGPRGENPLPIDQRDNYDNLILLCPTHHTTIDNNPETFSVERLLIMKDDHENWVTRKLDEGRIFVRQIDNSQFISARESIWSQLSALHSWGILSLTPLEIVEDLLDPLEIRHKEAVNLLNLPSNISINSIVNSTHTRPNDNGLLNEDLRKLSEGQGHKFQLFRNGHCEFLICLDGCIHSLLEKNVNAISYNCIRNSFRIQLNGLMSIWKTGLPFRDALLIAMITRTSKLHLDANFDRGGSKTISPGNIESSSVKYSTIVDINVDQDNLYEQIMGRIVNAFGWILKRDKRDDSLHPGDL